jgi:hypothetical protein
LTTPSSVGTDVQVVDGQAGQPATEELRVHRVAQRFAEQDEGPDQQHRNSDGQNIR